MGEFRDRVRVRGLVGAHIRAGCSSKVPHKPSSRQSELHHQHRSHHCLQCFCWLAWCGAGGVSIKQSAPYPSSQHFPVEYCTTQPICLLKWKVIQRGPHLRPPCQSALLGRHRQSHGRGIIVTITLQHQIRSSMSGPTLPIGRTQRVTAKIRKSRRHFIP